MGVGDHLVARAVDHHNGALDIAHMRERLARVVDEQAHGQPGVIARAHVGEAGVGRLQVELSRLVVRRKPRCKSAAKRLTKYDDLALAILFLKVLVGGLGVCILTTSRGVMTGRAAQQAGVGGEILCNVW